MSTQPVSRRTKSSTSSPIRYNNTSNGSDIDFDRNQSNSTDFTTNSYDEGLGAMFDLLTTLLIPSLLCFLFLFYNFIRLPQLRTKSNNFFIIILLTINFIHLLADLPFRLYYLHQGQVLIQNPIFCHIWTCYDNLLTTTDLFIMAFTSIERYLSVFHHQFLHRHRHFFYKPPVSLCFLIPTVWYASLTFGYACREKFMYFSFQCGTLCYLTSTSVFVNVENIGFFIFPIFVIVVANGTLIISVLLQRRSMRRQRRLGIWRNNVRMISQLLFIAILYMSIYVPSCVLLIVGSYSRRNRFQPWATSVRSRYFIHLKYLVIYGCPFMILAGQKELHGKLKEFFCCQRQQRRVTVQIQNYPMTVIQIREPNYKNS